MRNQDTLYNQFVQVLKEELHPAMGCTEPIAIAYAAAKAREVLGQFPEKITVAVSGNIIKNVKSVIVPHTGGLRGIPAAVASGIVAGDAEAELEVLSHVTSEKQAEIAQYLKETPISIKTVETEHILDIMIYAYAGEQSSFVRIASSHTNIICIEKNGVKLLEKNGIDHKDQAMDRGWMTVENIIQFADIVDLQDIAETLERQIQYNMAIAEEGLKGDYGANIGKILLKEHPNDLYFLMRAYAAAGSDARMNGCELPVVINSGSGNQGITASVPVIVYARKKGKTREQLLRALCVSNLITIHLKTGIGRLSAYCGVVSAGCGAAAGITYVDGGKYDEIAHTVVNALAMDSGIICDGAKASCAAKIAAAVDAGLLGLAMYQNGQEFYGGDGIVKKGVENTIKNIGILASQGMAQTDREIIRLMTEN